MYFCLNNITITLDISLVALISFGSFSYVLDLSKITRGDWVYKYHMQCHFCAVCNHIHKEIAQFSSGVFTSHIMLSVVTEIRRKLLLIANHAFLPGSSQSE